MSIIKIALDFQSKHFKAKKSYDNMIQRHMNATDGPYGKSALIGLAAGAGLGAATKSGLTNSALAGAGGAIIGLGIANLIHSNRAHKKAEKEEPNYHKIVNELNSYNDFVGEQAYIDENYREMARLPHDILIRNNRY
jgi:hypothetical protein